MDTLIEKVEYKGYTIAKHVDDNSINPFEDWDGIGKIIFHPKARYSCNTDMTYQEAKETKFSVPLSAYIHGGISLSVLGEGYRCQFDTSDYIAVWVPDQKNAPVKRHKKAQEYARQACKIFNQWANGDVYGFIVKDKEGNDVDSCWGFYGYEAVDVEIEGQKKMIDELVKDSTAFVKECIA